MTIDLLKELIAEGIHDIEFSYKGKPGSICCFAPDSMANEW